jgi:hypothetical protein
MTDMEVEPKDEEVKVEEGAEKAEEGDVVAEVSGADDKVGEVVAEVRRQ